MRSAESRPALHKLSPLKSASMTLLDGVRAGPPKCWPSRFSTNPDRVSRPYESRKQAASASSRPLEFIGRFFDKLKHYSAVATRYDKFARNFLAGVQMACA